MATANMAVPQGITIIDRRLYAFILALVSCVGLAFSAAGTQMLDPIIATHDPYWIVGSALGSIVLIIIGGSIARNVSHPMWRALFYALVAASVGFVLGGVTNLVSAVTTVQINLGAVLQTAIFLAVIMGVISVLFTGFLENERIWIPATVFVSMVGYVSAALMGMPFVLSAWNFFLTLGLTFYTVGHWYSAMSPTKTVDEAINHALGLYTLSR